jgi:hypothetical protein
MFGVYAKRKHLMTKEKQKAESEFGDLLIRWRGY